MTQFATERGDVLAQIKDVLYDRDWISPKEIERVKETTELRKIFALDFSGYGVLNTVGSIERLYGIQLDAHAVKKMTKVSQLIDAVMEQLEFQD